MWYCWNSRNDDLMSAHLARQSGPQNWRLDRLEPRGEVAQEWRFVAELQAANAIAFAEDFQDHFYDVVNVALRVDATRDGEADEVHFRGRAEHQRSDFYGADAAF